MDDTKVTIQSLGTKQNPVVMGTGLVALDVVIPNGLDANPQLRAGGTCGNVLTALAFLGWRSYPVARLSADGASKQIADDLRHWGVKLDFVTFDANGSTPVIIQHIRSNKTGEPVHSFSRKCPGCGAYLPWYKPVRGADVVDIAPRLPNSQVFFFDRTSRGALALAKQAADQGAMIFFEPSASSEPKLLEEALTLSHVVKVSSDRIGGNEAVLTSSKPKIVIETRGGSGLRLRYRSSEQKNGASKWHAMPSIPVEAPRDTAGAGDWCTAGIIHMLGAVGAKGLENLTLADVQRAVQVGQAMATWTCGFDGPRGGMYVSDKAAFQKSVVELLNGRVGVRAEMSKPDMRKGKPNVFACEACRANETKSKSRSARIRK